MPLLPQNWLTADDIANMLNLTGYDVVRHWLEVLVPFRIPFLSELANTYLVKLWPLRYLGMTNMIIARPAVQGTASGGLPVVC